MDLLSHTHPARALITLALALIVGPAATLRAVSYNNPIGPVVLQPLASTTVSLAAAFSNDADTFAAISSNPAAATVSLAGSSLTINALAVGGSVITVTATDTDPNPDETAQGTISVTVSNSAPAFNTIQSAMPLLRKNGANHMDEDESLTIAVNAGAASSNGDLLEALNIADADESVSGLGIAITGWTGNGTLSYSNASGGWAPLQPVSATQPFLLGPTHRLLYEGDEKNGETASITYFLWDGTQGGERAFYTIPGGTTGGSTAFSAATRTSSIPVDAVQDKAEINNVTTPVTGSDTGSVAAFAGITVDDVDRNPSDTLTVTITVSPKANGSLSQSGGGSLTFTETGISTGIYTATGTEASIEAALQALLFQPVSNLAPVGSITTTSLLATVSDNAAPTGNDDQATIAVEIASVNDVPVISPASDNQFVFSRATIVPFEDFEINDADVVAGGGKQTVSLSIVETFAVADGSFILANGSVSTLNTLTFNNLSIEAAVAELTGLRYVASSAALAVPETVVLSLVVTDQAGGASVAATVSIVVATPNISSNIRGTVTGQVIEDTGIRRLFEGVTITGTNVASLEVEPVVVTSSLNALTAGAGTFVKTVPSVAFTEGSEKWTFVGPASEATVALQQLAFKPTPNQFASEQTILFKLTLKDDVGAVIGSYDSRTTAVIVPVNDLPSFIKFDLLSPITDSGSVKPFPRVEIGDVDEKGLQNLDVTIELRSSLPAGTTVIPEPGTLAVDPLTSPLAALFGPVADEDGMYAFSGTPQQATGVIRALKFTPTANRLQPGMNETVTFRVRLDDGSGDIVVRDQVRVLVISENDVPVVTNPPVGQIDALAGNTIKPFEDAGTTLEDVDVNELVTVRIQLDSAAKGFLVDPLDVFKESPDGSGIYLATGLAADLETALQGLKFELGAGYPVPAGAPGVEVEFLVTITDRQAAKAEFSFSLLVRVDQVVRVVTNTADSGAGSLRQAIADAADNDHIAFDGDVLFGTQPTATIRLQSPLIIDKNLTITGPGTEKLFISGDSDEDGAADVQLFQVGSRDLDGTVLGAAYMHLSYLTLTSGSDEESSFGNGGAISVAPGSTLVLDHAEVLDCVAEQWGGAIDIDEGTLTVSHSLFAGNRTGGNLGEGGGAISLYTNKECSISNVTFSGNRQGGPSGLGGGALSVENAVPTLPLKVAVVHCTFFENEDAAGKGSSIRTNVFNTAVSLRNCLLADGDANPLDPSGAGRILSEGGNVADDDAMVWISQGGAPMALFLLDNQSDRTSQLLPLEPLADNGGQTRTHALPVGSPARVAGLPGSGTATDQRDVVRAATPDAGAFEAGTFKRLVINEIQFDPASGEAAYIEVVNPRDSETLQIGGLKLWVTGTPRHIFTPLSLAPGTAVLVRQAAGAITPTPPGGFPVQTASAGGLLGLGLSGGIVEVRGPSGVVASAMYLSKFRMSGEPTVELRGANESVTRSCEFLGALLPGPRTPGEEVTGIPLLEGNAPPVAYDDATETDEDTALEVIDVLANDFDADRTDVIRVVELPPTLESSLGATLVIVNDSTAGVAVSYDPTNAPGIQAIPLGEVEEDTFDYVILDYANGTTPNSRVRVPPINTPAEITEAAQNISRATGTVTIRITGVNDYPTPANDAVANLAALTTPEDVVLTFAADTLLDNDTDPDRGEGGRALRICWVKPLNFVLGDKDPTRVELGDLVTETALGGRAQLTLRADRTLSSITYDPSGSAILDALAVGETAVDSFQYLVIDTHGAPGMAVVSIVVTGVNDAPVARDDGPFATNEDTVLAIPFVPGVLGNDTDVDTTDTLSVVSAEPRSEQDAMVTFDGTRFLYNPTVSELFLQKLSKKEVIIDSFEYTIGDGNGGVATATILVRVTGVNDAPVAFADTAVAFEDGPVKILAEDGVLANDTDIDMNTLAPNDVLRALPSGMFTSLLGATVKLYPDGSFDYLPNGLFEGLGQWANLDGTDPAVPVAGSFVVDTFEYMVTDDGLVFANGDTYRVSAGQTGVDLKVLDNDVNYGVLPRADLVVTQVGLPSQGGTASVAPGGGSVFYSPAFGFVGTETFTYEVAAGTYGFCLAEVTVKVVPASGPIVGKSDAFTVAPNGTGFLDLLANDLALPGGTPVALVELTEPNQGGSATIAFQGGRSVALYAPVPGFHGTETFSYVASAGGGTTFGATVTITVPNRAGLLKPQADHFFVVADTGENILPVLANDGILPATAAGWTINPTPATLTTPSGGGTVSIASDGRSLRYAPLAGLLQGSETFSYGVVDAFGGTGTATVRITIGSPGFVAMNDAFAVNWNSLTNTLPVLANDVLLPNNGEKIEITFLNAPQHGTAAWNASRSAIVYTPTPGYAGPDTFGYEIGAATHPRRAATVTVTVTDRSGQLRGSNDAYGIAGDSRRNALRVLANDGVAGLGALPLAVTGFGTPNQNGTLEVAPAGEFIFYSPLAGFIGTETFTYTFSDGRGGTGSASVTLQVGEIFVGDDAFTVLSDSPAMTLAVLKDDRSLPDGPLVIQSVSDVTPNGPTVALAADGKSVLYTPKAGFTGVDTFTYAVANDSGELFEASVTVRVMPKDSDRATAVVSVTVRGANDAPTIGGVQAIEFLRDDDVAKPFASVVIGEVDFAGLQPLTVKVIMDDAAKGDLVKVGVGGTFIENPPGTYTFIGTAAQATTAIRILCFVPTDNRIEWSKHETATFTICVSDGIAPEVKDTGTTIEVYNIGQQFADNWIFGNGCTLSWDERRTLTVGQKAPFGLPLGGGGTWSDPKTGEWLLYSDGVSAWIPGAAGGLGALVDGASGTMGGASSDASMIPAMIVAKPGGDPRSELFVVAFGARSKNIHFTEIDLSLGTTGAVVGVAGREVGGSSPSQDGWVMLPQANNRDYWLIIGNGNAYPVTSTGVGTPVSNYNLDGSGASFRYSVDRRRIGVGWSSPKMYVYDFNPSTGVFGTSRIELNRGNVFFEFSHDGRKLYVNDTTTKALYQYDLSADPGPGTTTTTRSAAVQATEVLLHTYGAPDFAGDMALGPDGKIYIAGDASTPPMLHIIADPDASGAGAGLQLDAVALPAGCTLRQGLYHGLRVDDLIDEESDEPTGPFEAGRLAGVSSDGWTTVTLERSYASMVVVATPEYPNTGVTAVVPRIRNAQGNQFEVRLARADAVPTPPVVTLPVNYVVVEEGQYTLATDGLKMEAVRYSSTVTDRKASWGGQARTYRNSYSSPVVVGQVMTSNDPRMSVFWARGTNSSNPPVSGSFSAGKHIGADSALTRVPETVGYIVIESGTGQVGSLNYSAFLGADSVRGISDAPPYNYPVAGITNPVAAVVSSAAMDDTDGGWPVLFGASPLSATSISLAINEDQFADAERSHSTEQVAVLVLGNAGLQSPLLAVAAASLQDWRELYFSPEDLSNPDSAATLWGLEADSDGDGRSNIEEYAFGSDPWAQDNPEAVRLWLQPGAVGGSPQLALQYLRRADDVLLRYSLEQSSDLHRWVPASSRQTRSISISGTGYEAVTLSLDRSSTGGELFYRIRASR